MYSLLLTVAMFYTSPATSAAAPMNEDQSKALLLRADDDVSVGACVRANSTPKSEDFIGGSMELSL